MMRWLDGITGHGITGHGFEQAPGVGDERKAWNAIVHGVAKSWDTPKRLN